MNIDSYDMDILENYTLDEYKNALNHWNKALKRHSILLDAWKIAVKSENLEVAYELAKEIAITRGDEERYYRTLEAHGYDILDKQHLWDKFLDIFKEEDDLEVTVDEIFYMHTTENMASMVDLNRQEYKILYGSKSKLSEDKKLYSRSYMIEENLDLELRTANDSKEADKEKSKLELAKEEQNIHSYIQ